jgi:hypothetical protein
MKQSTIHLWRFRGWALLGSVCLSVCALSAVDAWITEDWGEALVAACLFALFMYCRVECRAATRDHLYWWCLENGVIDADGYPLTESRP